MGTRSVWLCVALAAVGCGESSTTTSDAAVTDAPSAEVTAPDVPAVDDVSDAPAPPVDAGLPPLDYTRDELWLCRPGIARDLCLSADLTTTELLADGTRTTIPSPPAATAPAYDCFYVYPTVDVTGLPGNRTDLTNTTPMLDPLLNQAAWFRGQCRVVAPLYRQATLLGLRGDGAAARLDLAFDDVASAFREYLRRDNGGRPFVLMGHSQGSFMTERLLSEVIAPDATLRARLIVALLLGGSVQVPRGALRGGSIGDVPLCASEDEVGCAVAYHTFGVSHPPSAGGVYPSSVRAGMSLACNNPVALAGGTMEARPRAVYLPTFAHQAVFAVGARFSPEVTTPFVRLRDFYSLRCVADANLDAYLELRAAPAMGDQRRDPIPYDGLIFAPSFLGLHLLDYNVALDDLLALVARKAERLMGGG